AQVVIQTDEYRAPTLTLELGGLGVDRDLGVSPAFADFGTLAVHTLKQIQIVLTNPSNVDLTITPEPVEAGIAPTLSTDLTIPFTLPAGASRTITLTYAPLAPTGAAGDTGSLTFDSSAVATATVTLWGRGE